MKNNILLAMLIAFGVSVSAQAQDSTFSGQYRSNFSGLKSINTDSVITEKKSDSKKIKAKSAKAKKKKVKKTDLTMAQKKLSHTLKQIDKNSKDKNFRVDVLKFSPSEIKAASKDLGWEVNTYALVYYRGWKKLNIRRNEDLFITMICSKESVSALTKLREIQIEGEKSGLNLVATGFVQADDIVNDGFNRNDDANTKRANALELALRENRLIGSVYRPDIAKVNVDKDARLIVARLIDFNKVKPGFDSNLVLSRQILELNALLSLKYKDIVTPDTTPLVNSAVFINSIRVLKNPVKIDENIQIFVDATNATKIIFDDGVGIPVESFGQTITFTAKKAGIINGKIVAINEKTLARVSDTVSITVEEPLEKQSKIRFTETPLSVNLKTYGFLGANGSKIGEVVQFNPVSGNGVYRIAAAQASIQGAIEYTHRLEWFNLESQKTRVNLDLSAFSGYVANDNSSFLVGVGALATWPVKDRLSFYFGGTAATTFGKQISEKQFSANGGLSFALFKTFGLDLSARQTFSALNKAYTFQNQVDLGAGQTALVSATVDRMMSSLTSVRFGARWQIMDEIQLLAGFDYGIAGNTAYNINGKDYNFDITQVPNTGYLEVKIGF